jgi:hypothetical protein
MCLHIFKYISLNYYFILFNKRVRDYPPIEYNNCLGKKLIFIPILIIFLIIDFDLVNYKIITVFSTASRVIRFL